MRLSQIVFFVILGAIIISGTILYSQEMEKLEKQKEIDDLYSLATIYLNQGKPMDAIRMYDKIIELDESQEDAWHGEGIRLNQFQICDKVVDHYEKYIELFPNSERAHEGYEVAETSC